MKKLTDFSDEELVQKVVVSGDTSAFGVLYDRYALLVYAKCKSFTSRTDEVDDLVQDIFVGVFVKLKMFRGESKFSTWLYSFTYNHCVNHFNRTVKKKRNEVSIDETEVEFDETDAVSDSEIFSLAADKLQEALKIIEPDNKVVLLMKYQDDLSIKEMIEVLGIGESAVKMRLHRAKKRIVEIYNAL